MGRSRIAWEKRVDPIPLEPVAGWSPFQLANQMRVFVLPTRQFKTTVIRAVFRHPLGEKLTETAMLPAVLARGCRRQRSSREIQRFLEENYGAGFNTDVDKHGEQHLLVFSMSFVNDRFLPGVKGTADRCLRFLRRIMSEPVRNGDGLDPEYVAQEKQNLANYLRGIRNNRGQWAFLRCMQEMFADEAYRHVEYGRESDLDSITPEVLAAHHRELISTDPLDVFVVGDVNPARMARRVAHHLDWDRTPREDLPHTEVRAEVDAVKQIRESMRLDQTRVILGYRTGITMKDPDSAALGMMNGLLGRFPHSLLFRNVREEKGLAYAVSSSTDRTKGVMFIGAGIEGEREEEYMEAIEEQWAILKEGRFSEADFEATRTSIVQRTVAVPDSPSGQIGRLLVQLLSGRPATPEESIAAIQKVTPADIQRVAERIQLDTVYSLSPEATP